MKPPVLCVVGPSDSGKTRVVEMLIRELSDQGYRIAAVKHCPHGYSLEKEGSDSHRMRVAGARSVTVVSPSEWVILEPVDGNHGLEDLLYRLGAGMDLVLAEGFRSSRAPKVLVRPEAADSTWLPPDDVVAVVSDRPVLEAPWQCGFDELERLAVFVEERFVKPTALRSEVSLVVDGKKIPLGGFASSILASTLRGMVKSLKGVPRQARELQLTVRGECDR